MAFEYLAGLRPSDDHHAQAVQQFRQSLEENRHGLHYPPQETRVSGEVEKLVHVVVGKWMNRQGVSWSRSGANAKGTASLQSPGAALSPHQYDRSGRHPPAKRMQPHALHSLASFSPSGYISSNSEGFCHTRSLTKPIGFYPSIFPPVILHPTPCISVFPTYSNLQ